PTADQRVGELREPHRRRGDVLAALLGVISVVEADADELLCVGDGSPELHLTDGEPVPGATGPRLELAQPSHVERSQQAANGPRRRLHRRDRDELLAELYGRLDAGLRLVAEKAHGSALPRDLDPRAVLPT